MDIETVVDVHLDFLEGLKLQPKHLDKQEKKNNSITILIKFYF